MTKKTGCGERIVLFVISRTGRIQEKNNYIYTWQVYFICIKCLYHYFGSAIWRIATNKQRIQGMKKEPMIFYKNTTSIAEVICSLQRTKAIMSLPRILAVRSCLWKESETPEEGRCWWKGGEHSAWCVCSHVSVAHCSFVQHALVQWPFELSAIVL